MSPHLIFHPTVPPQQRQGLIWFPWPGRSTRDAALLEIWAMEENWEHGASKPPFPRALPLLRQGLLCPADLGNMASTFQSHDLFQQGK